MKLSYFIQKGQWSPVIYTEIILNMYFKGDKYLVWGIKKYFFPSKYLDFIIYISNQQYYPQPNLITKYVKIVGVIS